MGHPSTTIDTGLSAIQALEARTVLQVYRRANVAFVRGDSAYLYDTENQAYLDFISGVGVASLGHANPRLASALAKQAETLLHTSNLFYHPLQGQVASRLATLSSMARTFFCNSGTEAVEACLKFARRYWHARDERGRSAFVALEGSFHGRTFGSLSVTADEHYRGPFAPLLPSVTFVSPDNPGGLLAAVTPATAAIIIEPIQGEGGVRPLTHAFAAALGEACARTGALLIADEVQTGLGRTGRPFYCSALGLKPDLMALGKALGAGVPIGAACMTDAIARTIAFGDHGSTYGGNLLACRAALVFLESLTEGGLLEHVSRVGGVLEDRLRGLQAKHAAIVDVRGAGLMWGLELNVDATPVVQAALARKLLVNRTAQTVVRLLPPLIVQDADIHRAVDALDLSLADALKGAAE